jgi:NADPH:quinone reductase
MDEMRAVWLRRFGPPEVLEIEPTPMPSPAAGQVLVEVARSSVTFVETQVRAGRAPFPVTLPMVAGNGVGGRVVAVGEGVDGALVGTSVVTTTGGSGGHAELATADADALVPIPSGVALDDATALLADGRTAWMLTEAIEPAPGERVLVLAAGGGVGTLLIQLAAGAGAIAVGAARGETKLATVEQLGAHEVIDYSTAYWVEHIDPVDVVFDGVGGVLGRSALELLAPGGRMISYGMASGEWTGVDPDEAGRRGVHLVDTPPLGPGDSRRLTAAALGAAARGELRPVVGQTVPLGSIAEAHAAIEARTTVGKTLLVV